MHMPIIEVASLLRFHLQGGLGIIDLEIQNRCLSSKWIINLLNTQGVWQSLLRNKCLNSKTLSQVKAKPYNSHFWRDLMKVKDEVFACGSFQVKDGTQTRFWEDAWIDERPLKESFPSLYSSVYHIPSTISILNQ